MRIQHHTPPENTHGFTLPWYKVILSAPKSVALPLLKGDSEACLSQFPPVLWNWTLLSPGMGWGQSGLSVG